MSSERWLELESAILNFAAQQRRFSDVLEFWLDTSVAHLAKTSPSLFLKWHAYTTTEDFESCLKKSLAEGDWGYVEDAVGEISDQGQFELLELDPQGIEKFLILLLQRHTALLAHYSKIFLHWVDNPRFIWIKR